MIEGNLFVAAVSRARYEYREPQTWQMDNRAWFTLLGDGKLVRDGWINPEAKTIIGLPVELLPTREHWNIIQLVTDKDGMRVLHDEKGKPLSALMSVRLAGETTSTGQMKDLEPITVEIPQ